MLFRAFLFSERWVTLATNWHEIRAEYVNGNISLRKLAEKVGVSYSQIAKVAASERWKESRTNQRIKIELSTNQKTQEKISEVLSDTFVNEAKIEAESRILAKELTLQLLQNVKDTQDTNDLRRLVQCLVDMGVFDRKNGENNEKKNNLLQAIQDTEEINTDDLPEVE